VNPTPIPFHSHYLEYVCEQLVEAVNAALRNDRRLDDNKVAVNPSTEHRMIVYWRTRPRRWEVRRFKRLVRRVMRQLLKADSRVAPQELYCVAPRYAPNRWNTDEPDQKGTIRQVVAK